jgi:uncharacterized protein
MQRGMATPMWVFLLLAFGLSWVFWLPMAAASHGLISLQWPPILAGLLGAFGPSLAALIITGIYQGRRGLRWLLGRLLVWRVGIQWFAFVLLWPAAISLAKTGLHVALGGSVPDFANPPVLSVYPVPPEAFAAGPWPLLPFIFLQQTLVGSSMGEELAWRGFLLPRLQARHSALAASVVVGILWGLWHVPQFLMADNQLAETSFGWFLLEIIANAVLFTWVYNNTRGSLLLALLFHTSINITYLFLSAPEVSPWLSLALEWGFVAAVIMVAGPAHLSRRPGMAAGRHPPDAAVGADE